MFSFSSIWSSVTGFFGGFQGYIIGGLLIAVAAGGAGAWAGYRIEASKVAAIQLADARNLAQATTKAAKSQAAQDQVSLDAAVAEAQAQTKIITKTVTLTKEVPVYVTPHQDIISCITVGLARVMRGAASGSDPSTLTATSGQSDDACSDVTASEMAGWFAEYAGASQANAEQLTALQAWIVANHKAQEANQ